jgi:hypothetical protein
MVTDFTQQLRAECHLHALGFPLELLRVVQLLLFQGVAGELRNRDSSDRSHLCPMGAAD